MPGARLEHLHGLTAIGHQNAVVLVVVMPTPIKNVRMEAETTQTKCVAAPKMTAVKRQWHPRHALSYLARVNIGGFTGAGREPADQRGAQPRLRESESSKVTNDRLRRLVVRPRSSALHAQQLTP
jgi:hypothetical protein